jgi:hypothetical protein
LGGCVPPPQWFPGVYKGFRALVASQLKFPGAIKRFFRDARPGGLRVAGGAPRLVHRARALEEQLTRCLLVSNPFLLCISLFGSIIKHANTKVGSGAQS